MAGGPAEVKLVVVVAQTTLQSLTVLVIEQDEEDEDVRDALPVCVVGSDFGGSGFGGTGFGGSGFDGSGFDGSGLDGSGIEGSGFEGSGLDGSGLEGSGFEGSDGPDVPASLSVAGGGQLILTPKTSMQGKENLGSLGKPGIVNETSGM